MSVTDNGGQAFPVLALSPAGEEHYVEGMSLRDWFAGQALNGFIARCASHDDWARLPLVVYEVADAMLKAREVRS